MRGSPCAVSLAMKEEAGECMRRKLANEYSMHTVTSTPRK
jgi:hypothetical protein